LVALFVGNGDGSGSIWTALADGRAKSLSRDTTGNYGNDPNNSSHGTPSPGLGNY